MNAGGVEPLLDVHRKKFDDTHNRVEEASEVQEMTIGPSALYGFEGIGRAPTKPQLRTFSYIGTSIPSLPQFLVSTGKPWG
jgi:hypothetical protein